MTANGEEVADLPHNKSNTISETISSAVENAVDRFKNTKGKTETNVNNQDSDNSGNNQVVYSSFSDSSESYVQEKFASTNSDDKEFIANISNHQDYSIPEGKNLCSEYGSVIAVSGDTLSFDGKNYIVKSSSGDLDRISYSLDYLAKTNFSDIS